MVKKYKQIIKQLLAFLSDYHRIWAFIRKSFTENLTLKMISAMMTLTLFILIAGESVQISKAVTIEYVLPEDKMIVNHIPFEFEMILSGPKSTLGAIRSRDYSYKVSLTNAVEGVSRVRLNPRTLGIGRGVIISSIMPSIVYPRLEKVIQKKVPVQVHSKGKPRDITIKSFESKIKEVMISGPKSVIAKITKIYTEALDLTKVNKTGDYKVPLRLPHEMITLIDPSNDEIEVSIEVIQVNK